MTHVSSSRMYYVIFGALVVLTILTVAVTYIELGPLNSVIALAIALTKASLVVWFFMHVNQSSALTKLFVVAGLFWFAILVGLTLSDYFSRDWLPVALPWAGGEGARQDPRL